MTYPAPNQPQWPPQQPGQPLPGPAAQPQPGYAQPGYAQPGYDQPGYAQPGYGHPPPGPRRRGGGGKIAGIVLAVVGGLVLVCGGASAAAYFTFLRSGDPEQVVTDYYLAAARGDCEEMTELVTESTWRQGGTTSRGQAIAECRDGMRELGGGLGMLVIVEDTRLVSKDGDTAVVAASLSVTPPPGAGPERIVETVDHTLRKDRRDWLIDGAAGTPGPDTGGFDFAAPGVPGLDDPEFELGGDPEPPPGVPEPEPPPPPPPAAPPPPPPPPPGSLGMSPEDTVLSFYGAWQRSECDGMADLSTAEYWTEGEFDSSSSDPETICRDAISSGQLRTDLTWVNEGGFGVEYDDETYDVAVATVSVRHSFGHEPESSWEFILIDSSGYWLVHGSGPP